VVVLKEIKSFKKKPLLNEKFHFQFSEKIYYEKKQKIHDFSLFKSISVKYLQGEARRGNPSKTCQTIETISEISLTQWVLVEITFLRS
jgi:hypothetical protein